tara:strand:- start:6175 stop:6864 length:690 start_codon:yes stop_codon:yes gene_type:complete
MDVKAKLIQQALRFHGYSIEIDGSMGKKTRAAMDDYAWESRTRVSPVPGLENNLVLQGLDDLDVSNLPRVRDRISVYGMPKKNGFTNLVKMTTPYTMSLYEDNGPPVTKIWVHKLVKDRFEAMFEQWLNHFGQDGILENGLHIYDGCYVHRNTRGGSSWSDHAFGIAMDINAAGNGLMRKWDRSKVGQSGYASMPVDAINIAQTCGLRNIAANLGRDSMHFSAVNYGLI